MDLYDSRTPILITGAHVITNDGDAIDGGDVLIEDGKIKAVGKHGALDVPDGTKTVDASGKWVVPGFFEPHSHVGIHEEGNGPMGNDTNERTNPNTAGVRAIDAVNIEDEGFKDALRGGITSMIVKPGSANVIGGRSVALKTWGGRTIDEQVMRDEVSVKSALGENPKRVYGEAKKMPSTRLGVAFVMREAFVEAQHYAAERAQAKADGKPFKRDLAKETLADVLDGRLVWDQHTHRHDDIATAMRIADEFGYKLVINHGTEGDKIADVIAEKGIPVIYGPVFTTRSKVELKDRGIQNLVALDRAGVKVALTTDAPVVPIELLVYQATLAHREGLSLERAIEAVTKNPAEMFDFGDRIGSLKPGADADVVIWSGNPLDSLQRVERVFIDGREMYRNDGGEHIYFDRRSRFAVPDDTMVGGPNAQ